MPKRPRPCVFAAILAVLLSAAPTVAQQRVEGTRFVVATGHPEATAAGMAVLRDGGNAIDAAVAASLSLGVAVPYGSGMGGKMVLLYRDPASSEVHCVEALCPSPAGADAEEFVSLPRSERRRGYKSVCVPGLPAGLYEAHQRWGSRPWASLVEPAIRLAGEGVVVSEEMHSLMAPHEQELAANPETASIYLREGKVPPVGRRFDNPELAETLRLYAQLGAKGFYEGATAERIVEAARAGGSRLSARDLAEYRPRFTEPLALNFRGYRLYSSPPPLTGGLTVLTVLKGLEATDWPEGKPRDAAYIDKAGRLLQVFYPRISEAIADTEESAALARDLLEEQTIDEAVKLAASLDPRDPKATLAGVPAEATLDDREDAGTSHLVVIDSNGAMVSLTQSLSLHFGAYVAPPGTGVLLNNSMSNFTTSWESSPNYVAPGKRPRSTVAPVLVTRDGAPTLALGIPGGQRIPTTTLQLLTDTLLLGLPLDKTFDRPRFHLRRPTSAKQPPNMVDLERGAPEEELAALREDLRSLGWRTQPRPSDGGYFGGGSAAGFLPGGRLEGVADRRRTNYVAGE